jgi:serine/threonine protein kinase/WD40 repeat protein
MLNDEQKADRLVEIFNEANALSPGPQRDRFIADNCGEDAALREEILRLLRAFNRAGGFLAYRPCETAASGVSEKPGDRIGPYTLMGKLGEGGCGIVYEALREAPLRRTVALKIVKPGMDTKSVVTRFEAERQALALMEHPCIARVYEAGTTESGRPYFAMELVHGIRITEYCAQHRLSAAERLQLFVKVCRAVEHAHQKGVIHRDLKPANVMVTEEEGVPAPKIIDFGIAKAMGPQLTEHTIYTTLEQFIGTPAYMSPEQVAGSVADIDTRSDIYSLGVLLYEMLTGSPPFDQRRMLETGMEEMRRVIREDEPARPSTRILQRTRGSTGTDVAACREEQSRHTTPDLKETVHRLRGDLDWVILKCLEKDRERRYPSANGLAGDIERHLRNEPVLATPPSLSYRLRKLTLRHKTAVVAGLVVFLALVAGLIATTWGMVRAHRAEREGAKQLCDSLVAQARALRFSNQSGRRFDGLDLLQRARGIARDLQLPADDLRPMRNAVTAALSVSDLQLGGPRVAFPPDAFSCDFDASLTICAITFHNGDCSIRNVATDTEIFRLPGEGKGISKGAFVQLSADARYAAVQHPPDKPALDSELLVWNLGPGNPHTILRVPRVQTCSFRRSELLAAGDRDGAISLFSLPDVTRLHQLPPGRPITEIALALHPSEPLVAAASYFADGVEIRNFRTGELVHFLAVGRRVTCLGWTPGGDEIAIGSEARGVAFYRRSTWERTRDIPTRQTVTAISFSPDGAGMAVTGWSNMVEVFDNGTRQPNLTWPGPQFYPRFSPDGSRLAPGMQDGRLGIFNVGAPGAMRLFRHHGAGPGFGYVGTSLHPGGRLLALATTEGYGFWDLVTGREEVFIPAARYDNNRVLFDPSGNLLVATLGGIFRRSVSMDPVSPGTFTIGPPVRLDLPLAVQITQSRDSKVVAASARSAGVYLKHAGAWILHVDRNDPPLHLDPGADIFKATVSPDGKWVATVDHSTGIAKLWDAGDGTLVKQFEGRAEAPFFTDEGRWLLTSGRGGRLVSMQNWETVRAIDDALIVPSPDSRLAAVAKESGVSLVELVSGKEVAMLERPSYENLANLDFSPDGSKLLVTHTNQGVEVWDLRLIREKLKELDLDWDWPAFPPAPRAAAPSVPLRVHLVDSDK